MEKAEIIRHFDSMAADYDAYLNKNAYYHYQINSFIASVITPKSSVLEIGSATGALVSALANVQYLGIDFSPKMVEAAAGKFPGVKFLCSGLSGLREEKKYDFCVMSNLLDYLPDIWTELELLKKFMHQDSKLIITTSNPLWEPVLRMAAQFRLKTPDGPRNFITNNDIMNFLQLLDYEVIEYGYRIFLPKGIPAVSAVINKIIPLIPGFRNLCAMQFIIARVKPEKTMRKRLSCSVIIPCHNEADTIENCLSRVPAIGSSTEVIVVDDGSSDATALKVRGFTSTHTKVRLISYPKNKGKGFAVKTGFDAATGDVLMILDADMAVEPEELPRFFELLEDGRAEFVNGTRMIYPRENESMKLLNFIGNKFFGIILSLIMGQRNTDTLCGTKALRKKHYLNMKLGDCPWGDFDLLFGAAKLRLKMVELPVHYKKRFAGQSKMKPFKHGWQLLKMCGKGVREIN